MESKTTPKEMAMMFFQSQTDAEKETIIATMNASYTTEEKQDFVTNVIELVKPSNIPPHIFPFIKNSLEMMLNTNEE